MYRLIKILIIGLPFVLFYNNAGAQRCTTLGQTASTAFPVCGSAVFSQTNVPICVNTTLVSRCTDFPYQDKNPFWYQFTCYNSGTLGFVITPNALSDDYDWQMYDITGHNPIDAYTDTSLFVACNWSGESGQTGASALGSDVQLCAGFGVPLFTSMPFLQAGHTYLLMVSHFTDSQSGYSLSFGVGTAVITDSLPPHLQTASVTCDGTQLFVKLNKQMRCNSLSADGSDFVIQPNLGNVVSAAGVNCNNGFDMDSIILNLDHPLIPGNYQLVVQTGNDGNTLLDNCDAGITVGELISFTLPNSIPAQVDSITPPGCNANSLELFLDQPVDCNSIAADGSDFLVNGPEPVTVIGATPIRCVNGFATGVNLLLGNNINTGGNYQLFIQKGSDSNTVLNSCNGAIIPGYVYSFTAKDTLNAHFQVHISAGCIADTLDFLPDHSDTLLSRTWTFEDGSISHLLLPVRIYPVPENAAVQLSISNGTCSAFFNWSDYLPDYRNVADFNTDAVKYCVKDTVSLSNLSTGDIQSQYWSWGDGTIDTIGNHLQHQYFASGIDTIQLVVISSIGCKDTLRQQVQIKGPIQAGFQYQVTESCHADSIQFIAIPGNGIVSWNWHFEDGSYDTIANPLKIYSIFGIKQVSLSVSDGVCSADSSVVYQLLDHLPHPAFSVTDATVCLHDTISIVNHSTGDVQGVLWNWGDGTLSFSNTPGMHVYQASGQYDIGLYLTSSTGCKDSLKLPVVVHVLPTPDFNFSSACLPMATVTFSNLSSISDGTTNAMLYQWNFGDSLNGNNTSLAAVPAPHTYTTPGPYTIQLTVTSNEGCIATLQKQDSLIFAAPLAAFTTSTTGVCLGQLISFADHSLSADGSIVQWLWDFGDGQQAVLQQPPPHKYVDTFVYHAHLQVIDSHRCMNVSPDYPLTIYSYPVLELGADRYLLEGEQLYMVPQELSGNQLQYAWSPVNLFNQADLATPYISQLTADTVTCYLTVTSIGGCSVSDYVLIHLLKNPVIPNTITPNNDQINDSWKIDYLNGYPHCHVEVYNRYGQLVFESIGYSHPWDGTYNNKPLPAGTYYYIIDPGMHQQVLKGYVTIIR